MQRSISKQSGESVESVLKKKRKATATIINRQPHPESLTHWSL